MVIGPSPIAGGRASCYPQPMNVEQGISWYLDTRYGTLRASSWEKHRMTLNIFGRAFAGRELDDITKDEIRAWRNSLAVKPSTANKYIDRVKALYVYLNREEKSTRNPADIDPLDEEPARRVRLPAGALSPMLRSSRHPRDTAIVATSIELLLRGGEVAELRVSDLSDGILRVLVEKGKGELVEDEMGISANLESALHRWLAVYRREAGIIPGDAYLFPRMVTRKLGTTSRYVLRPTEKMAKPEEVVKLALKNAGFEVPKGTGVHAIRRTCARLLFDHLVTSENPDRALAHVSSLMHHASRQTTELYLGQTGDRVLRNKLIRAGGSTPLTLALATSAKPDSLVSEGAVVYAFPRHTV